MGLEGFLNPTVMQVIDEMKCSRYIEHKGSAKMITPFVGKQLFLCEAFGLKVPEGCDIHRSKRVNTDTGKKKRGGTPKHNPDEES